MTDRELLEKAAKAAGYKPDGTFGKGILCVDRDGRALPFNPLNNDSDALRLAVKLGLRIDPPKHKGFGSTCGNMTVFREGCPYAQTREAIVRAAASIETAAQ